MKVVAWIVRSIPGAAPIDTTVEFANRDLAVEQLEVLKSKYEYEANGVTYSRISYSILEVE